MVAGGEGIPVILPAFEIGIAERLRVFEEHPERLGELVVLLDQRLVIHLPQEGGLIFVLGRGGDEMGPGFQIKPLLVCQHPVPDVTAAAEGLFKELRLGRVGIEPDLDGGKLRRLVVWVFSVCGVLLRHGPGTSFPRF